MILSHDLRVFYTEKLCMYLVDKIYSSEYLALGRINIVYLSRMTHTYAEDTLYCWVAKHSDVLSCDEGDRSVPTFIGFSPTAN